jgi:ATP-binding cassette subfamily A (ABC1) protein 3
VGDMINYLIPVFLILIVFAAFNSDAFVKDHRLGLLFGMFLLFGWGSLPFVYIIQFVFKTPPAGMVKIYPGHCQMNALVKGGSLLLLND